LNRLQHKTGKRFTFHQRRLGSGTHVVVLTRSGGGGSFSHGLHHQLLFALQMQFRIAMGLSKMQPAS
jgi:hypothetical protein